MAAQRFTGGVQHGEFHQHDAAAHLGRCLDAAVHLSGDVHVFQTVLLPGVDFHPAGDAGKAPEILIFQPGSVAPAEDLQRYEILSFLDKFSDVKTGFQLAVLAISHHFAVHPNPHVGGS